MALSLNKEYLGDSCTIHALSAPINAGEDALFRAYFSRIKATFKQLQSALRDLQFY